MDTDDSAVSRRGFIRAAAGAGAASAAVGGAAAQEGNETGGNGTDSGGGGLPGAGQTETVALLSSLVFDPENLTVLQGTTVNFVWESDGHNIVVDSQPDGAGWEGTEGGASQLYDTGYEYSHTFDTLGTYEYACAPHRQAGMVGTIEVVEEISTPEPAQGPPPIPDSAKTLGIAATIGLGSTLGLAYFLMRFGGDYEQ
ncbi:cupredoxin domain-containing protein [Halosegnis marinus]|uniref:Plastocyanin/azurin family copper-binding protein n=1 Tax=Halosegnis marinus TaxID=3034023 RepID=A0ABD5ZQS4_9EURY|nr:plastocyanin/azurin family copper-binding protein [Halosegnis sp. DT85]